MEMHAPQPEELNASAKIAPCGWSPVADRGKFSPLSHGRIGDLIDQQEHHNTMWQKSEMGT